MTKSFTNKELKAMARGQLLGKYRVPMAAFLITLLIPMLLLMPFEGSEGNITYIITELIISLISAVLSSGCCYIHLGLATGQEVHVIDVFYGFRNQADKFFAGTILLTVLAILPLLPSTLYALIVTDFNPIIAFLLAIGGLAATIYISLKYSLIYYLYITDASISVTEAFNKSNRLMDGKKMQFFTLTLSFAGWLFLGMLSLGIGLLWIMPYLYQTEANFYLMLTTSFSAEVTGDIPPAEVSFQAIIDDNAKTTLETISQTDVPLIKDNVTAPTEYTLGEIHTIDNDDMFEE